MVDDKVRENRLRRKAARLGLILQKSRRRDPDALDFGLYVLRDEVNGNPIHADIIGRFVHSLTLDDVEGYLTDESTR